MDIVLSVALRGFGMSYKYKSSELSQLKFATSAITVDLSGGDFTPSYYTRSVYVGLGGDLSVILADDDSAVTYYDVPSGWTYPLSIKLIVAEDTTADNIVVHF